MINFDVDAENITALNMISSFTTPSAMIFDASPTGASTAILEVIFSLYKPQIMTGIYPM